MEENEANSKKEFHRYLNIARRSTFENANILMLLERRKLIDSKSLIEITNELELLRRKITSFQKSLFK